MMLTHRPIARLSYGVGAVRDLPSEVAVALSFNGTTQAVMMASPADLTDFAYGFALTEGIATADQIDSVTIVETSLGIDVQIWVGPQAEARLAARRRTMTGPVGCGLCGIDSLEQAMRAVAPVTAEFTMTPDEIKAAIAALPAAQPLHDTTRAVHAAGFWHGELVASREDVGRHNALDKLIGSRVRDFTHRTEGAILLTSRVSIDMVQKVAAFGAPILIAVSAPTAHAVTLADQAGITLIALARPDGFQAFTHTDRIQEQSHAQ
jgi:FdhD protein